MVIKFCVSTGKSPAEMMRLIRRSETMNPCSVSTDYKWHEKIQIWKRINGGRNREMVCLEF